MSTAALTAHETPHAPPRTAVFGMTIFLASEAMLFAGLIAGYIVLRLSSPAWPPSRHARCARRWPCIMSDAMI